MTITLRRNPSDRILELGGGDKPYVIPRCMGGNDLNIDVRACYDAKGRQTVDFTVDLNEPLPISDSEWDGLFSHFAIEHVSWRKLPSLLKEMHRVVKPGGRCVIVTANTEAQIEYIKNHPDGWEDRDAFTSFSITLFGDQDYAGNFHSCYLSPKIITKLFTDAGFENVLIYPYGAIQTDMVVEATRPISVERNGEPVSTPEIPIPASESKTESTSKVEVYKELDFITTEGRKNLYDRAYFNGGAKVGGYAPFYLDYPCHEVTARFILLRKPKSVLELGCARGYVLKRIQDAGVIGCGLEISEHCRLTKVADGVNLYDVCNTPWNIKDKTFDLVYSIGLLDHIPEQFVDAVSAEMDRVARRGLHGIDYHPCEKGDQTRCCVRSKEWWMSKLPPGHEVVEKAEMEDVSKFPPEALNNAGKNKLNIGCAYTAFHYGWVNIDIENLSQFLAPNGYAFRQHDMRTGIPYGTGSVDLIYSAHFLEHLTYDEGRQFLLECRRVLNPETGALRLIVPDAKLLMGKYLDPNNYGSLSEYDELQDECKYAKTSAGKLYALLHQHHLSTYDDETLLAVLGDAGLEPVVREFREAPKLERCKEGFVQMSRETLDLLPCLSLYVDAVPVIG